jgi:ketosteroid isomerase-like protein
MSQGNVEVVRQSLEAYARRDVAAMRELNDPEMELDWSASRSWLAGVYRGFDEALRFYEGYFEAFARIEFEPSSFIEMGESVVVPNVARQWGRDGIEVSARSTLVFTLRRGRIVRTCLFQTTEQALAACREGTDTEGPAEELG